MSRKVQVQDTPLTHEERRKLIEAPFICQVIGGKGWSGTGVSDHFFQDGKRRAYTSGNGGFGWLRTASGSDIYGD